MKPHKEDVCILNDVGYYASFLKLNQIFLEKRNIFINKLVVKKYISSTREYEFYSVLEKLA